MNTHTPTGSGGGTFQRYDPTKTLFRNVTKINPYLLQDVVNCYKRSKTVCRSCFYKHKYQEPIGANRHCRRCKRTAHPLTLIPASQMCDNLVSAKFLAIPAPPKAQMALANKYVHTNIVWQESFEGFNFRGWMIFYHFIGLVFTDV